MFCFVPFKNLQEKDNRYHIASLMRKPEPKPWNEDFPPVHCPTLPGGCYCAGLFGSHWAFTESISRHLAISSLHVYPKSLPIASLILSHTTTFCRKVFFSDLNVIMSSHFIFSGTYTSMCLLLKTSQDFVLPTTGSSVPFIQGTSYFTFVTLESSLIPRACFNSVSL